MLGGLIWAITGSGAAPDHDIHASRRMARWAQTLVGVIGRVTGNATKSDTQRLSVDEVVMPPFPKDLCRGVLAMDGLERNPVIGFKLSSRVDTRGSRNEDGQRRARAITRKRAILWLSGGGYVTGYPLVDPPLFSLIRDLPAGDYTILGPNIRKSLSMDRAFPIPLLDALAGYAHLREVGYEADDIIVMGNSAGSGLSWSLMSYLISLDEAGVGSLGSPGTIIMISVSVA